MKYKLSEKELELMKKVSNETITDYKIDNQDYIEVDALISAISDLVVEIDDLQEKIKDIEQDRDDNYRRIPVAEQVGISDKDFY